MAGAAALAADLTAAHAQTHPISIPEESLSQSLKDIGHQSGENILFMPAEVAGLRAHAIEGTISADAAVRRAIEGTDLEVVRDSAGGLIIRRATARKAATAERSHAAPLVAQIAERSSATLETVVITAEKHRADVQKTADSVAVIPGDGAMRRGLTQLDQVMPMVGAVKLLEGEDGPTFYIRGIGTGVPGNIGDPEVSLNIDGIYQSEPEFARGGLYDVSRVEVLRGPQGTLYGRNAVAGVVNVITNDPDFAYSGGVSAGIGAYDLFQAQGFVNLPLSDTLALRAAFGIENHAGYLSNGADDMRVQSGRLKLLWQPSDRTRLVLATDYTHEGGEGEGEIQVHPPIPSGFVTNPAYPGGINFLGDSFHSSNPWTSPDPNTTTRHTNFWSVYARLDWNLGFANLTALPAYRSYSYQCRNCWRSETDQNQWAAERQTSVELRLASEPGSSVTWLAGLYYLDANAPTRGQNLNPGFDSFTDPAVQVNEQAQTEYSSKSYAAFGQATYPLSRTLRLTAGLRYTEDQKAEQGYALSRLGNTIIACSTDPAKNPPPWPSSVSCLFDPGPSATWDAVTYTAGIAADVGASSMLYAKVSSGYKAGGFFQGAVPNSYKPEHLTSYEIGSKNRFFGGRLQINADAFYYDYRDYQVYYLGFINPASADIFGILTLNAPGATVYGADIEARYRITARDEIDAAIYPLRARFGALVVPSPVGGPPVGGTYSGFPLPFAPQWSANLAYQHNWDLGAHGALTTRIETHLETATWVTFDEKPGTRQPPYSASNIYFTYDIPNGRWSLTAYVRNMENAAVLANGQNGPAGLVTADIAPPRTYGFQLTAMF